STDVGVESTIAKVTPDGVRILRPGGVTAEDVEAVSRKAVLRGGVKGIEAPGMMLSHYAPNAGVRLNATELRDGEALLAFGPSRLAGGDKAVAMRNLSETGLLREAAANLYHHLQALDRSAAPVIAVEPIPAEGL